MLYYLALWKFIFIIVSILNDNLNAVPILTLCPSPVKNQNCVLQCSDSTLSGPVSFYHPIGTLQGSCPVPGVFALCRSVNYVIYQYLPDAYLNISSLDRNRDEGEWQCVHGSSNSQTQILSVTSPLRTQKTPRVAISDSKIKITCEMVCQYPTGNVSVEVIYVEEGMKNYRLFPSTPAIFTDFTYNTGCDSYESNYKAEFTFTISDVASLAGKNLTYKCNYTQSIIQTSTGDTGPASAPFNFVLKVLMATRSYLKISVIASFLAFV